VRPSGRCAYHWPAGGYHKSPQKVYIVEMRRMRISGDMLLRNVIYFALAKCDIVGYAPSDRI
jgi:hypothetical protein